MRAHANSPRLTRARVRSYAQAGEGTGSPYYRLHPPHRRTHILLNPAFEAPAPAASPAAPGPAPGRRGSWSPAVTPRAGSESPANAAGVVAGEDGGAGEPSTPAAAGTWC